MEEYFLKNKSHTSHAAHPLHSAPSTVCLPRPLCSWTALVKYLVRSLNFTLFAFLRPREHLIQDFQVTTSVSPLLMYYL